MWGRKRVSLGWGSGGILCERVLDRPSSRPPGSLASCLELSPSWEVLSFRLHGNPDWAHTDLREGPRAMSVLWGWCVPSEVPVCGCWGSTPSCLSLQPL